MCRFVLALAAALLGALLAEPEAAAAETRPNIVFIMTDDQAPWAVGAAGRPDVRTPNLDRLFHAGAYLVNSFTCTPVCSPSRASLMTSRYGSELGITDWINPAREPELGLDPATVTWPEVLQAAGYKTGLVGKWHLGLPDPYHPTKTGFDVFSGFRGGGTSPRNAMLEVDGKVAQRTGFTTDVLTDYALEFIRGNHRSPFLLCLHYRAPHAPYLPVPEENWSVFENLDPVVPNPDFPKLDVTRVRKLAREYLASVYGIDQNVGRVVALLDELKIADNTVVVFTSDHGYNIGHNGIWHKGNGHWILTENPPATPNIPAGQRPNMFDTSLRLPTCVRWPAAIRPGTVIKETISMIDWYPTLLALAGAKTPAGETIRGHDFSPLLRGEKIAWNNDLYAEYSTHHQSKTHMRAYRTPEWKLKRDFLNPERDELYHLVDDPAETKNLIESASADVAAARDRLHAAILNKMREVKDPVLGLAETRAGGK
jgi:choline-sulfatase